MSTSDEGVRRTRVGAGRLATACLLVIGVILGHADVGAAQESNAVIQSINPAGFCLTVPNGGTANGTQLRMETCSAESPHQVVRLVGRDGLRFYGKCMGVQPGNLRDGAPVGLWDCLGGPTQSWGPASAPAGIQIAPGSASPLCLTMQNQAGAATAPLIVSTCKNIPGMASTAANQLFFYSSATPQQIAAAVSLTPPSSGVVSPRTVPAQPSVGREVLDPDHLTIDPSLLANASPFTMPMGNNFTLPTGCGGVSCDRSTQALQQNVAGLLHVMGAANAAALQCVSALGPSAKLWRFGVHARNRPSITRTSWVPCRG